MPPQETNLETNLRSATGRDAAGLRLVSALMKDAAGSALAAAHPDARIASPRDASPEKQAAGPPAASAGGILHLLRQCWRAFQHGRQRERLRASLQDLSERELMDIGLTPGDIDYIAAHRALERLREGRAHLWLSRGVM